MDKNWRPLFQLSMHAIRPSILDSRKALSLIHSLPINARIIGTHEHESHFVFDILFNNTTAVQPQIHSTDVHGVNRLNFALLHLFGYQFAPRYKDFYEQVQTGLHGFQSPADYDETWLIKPIRKLQPDYIIPEWVMSNA